MFVFTNRLPTANRSVLTLVRSTVDQSVQVSFVRGPCCPATLQCSGLTKVVFDPSHIHRHRKRYEVVAGSSPRGKSTSGG